MSLFDRILHKNTPANIAKDRLTFMLAHERSVKIPYIEEMKQEILEVVRKYTHSDKISIKADSNQNINTLEVEITLG